MNLGNILSDSLQHSPEKMRPTDWFKNSRIQKLSLFEDHHPDE